MLGSSCVAVILHGSLASGSFNPARSDVDLLAVTGGPVGDESLAALSTRLGDLPLTAPLDLRLVKAGVATAPTMAPELEAYVRLEPDRGSRIETRRAPERDLVVELSLCRAQGVRLAGVEPASLIGHVPDEWVLRVGDAQLADWQAIGDDPDHAELTVLTACRVWLFAVERRYVSKEDAAEWVLAREPSLAAVRAALGRRRGEWAPIANDGVQRLLSLVRGSVGIRIESAEAETE